MRRKGKSRGAQWQEGKRGRFGRKCVREEVMGEPERGGLDTGLVRGRVGGPPGLLVLIGLQAPGHAATTSKVRYTSSTARKCWPTWGRAAGQRVEGRKRGREKPLAADQFERKKTNQVF